MMGEITAVDDHTCAFCGKWGSGCDCRCTGRSGVEIVFVPEEKKTLKTKNE